MSIFVGSGAAICTPFDKNGKFNPDAYEKFIDFQVKNGTDAIITCGSTGEASTLDTDEHIEAVRVAVCATKKACEKYGRKVPVVAGAGGNDTAYSIELSKQIEATGVDALMVVTPYYNKTSPKGLFVHYSAIAKAIDLPIMLYNVPVRTGMNVKAETLAELAKIPNIVAIKEASSDIVQISEMAERCGDKIDIYCGNDDHVLPVLALGGKGVVSTTANIAPTKMHNIVEYFMAGDIEKSRKQQLDILPLVRLMFADINPMPVKAAVNILGFDMGSLRLPLIDVEEDSELFAKIKDEMRRQGLI